MWPGPYGEWGSRKYLIASLDQSLSRMGLDTSTSSITIGLIPKRRWKKPWARSMRIVRSVNNLCWDFKLSTRTDRKAQQTLRRMGTPCIIHQPSYNMFNGWIEGGLLQVLDEEGIR